MVPAEVRDRGQEMTDDEVIAAFVANGQTEGYARVYLDRLRGRARGPVEGLPDTLA